MQRFLSVLRRVAAVLAVVGGIHGCVHAQEAAESEVDFVVSRFVFRYVPPEGELAVDPGLPPLDIFTNIRVRLEQKAAQWRLSADQTDRGNGQWVSLRGDGIERRWSASALVAANRAIVRTLNQHGVFGVLAEVDPDQIDLSASPPLDMREGNAELRILVYYSTVAEVGLKRLAQSRGALLQQPESVGRRILRGAPLSAGALLRKNVLQAYLDRVNQFGGRRVEVALSPGDRSGTVKLTLDVTEQKRASAYFQTSNTGTEATGYWRSRMGGELRQLAGVDDALRLDYSTTDFERYQALTLLEEFGLAFPDVLKSRVFASYSKLSLADLGQTGLGFESISQTLGAQLIWTPWVIRGYPVSWTGSLHFMDARVRNSVLGAEGGSGFWVSSLGVGTERQGARLGVGASLALEHVSTADADQDLLGRNGASREFWLARWNLSLTRRALRISDFFGGSGAKQGGGHELSFSARGQTALEGARLSPQLQGVAGGMDTVRGYRESPAAGDSVAVTTLEYRWRVSDSWGRPRNGGSAPVDSQQGDALGAPLRSRGASTEADRDIARGARTLGMTSRSSLPFEVGVRGFLDGGWVGVHEQAGEATADGDRTLLGAGVGVDVSFRGMVNGMLRTDLAFALKEQPWARQGSSRLHVSLSVLW